MWIIRWRFQRRWTNYFSFLIKFPTYFGGSTCSIRWCIPITFIVSYLRIRAHIGIRIKFPLILISFARQTGRTWPFWKHFIISIRWRKQSSSQTVWIMCLLIKIPLALCKGYIILLKLLKALMSRNKRLMIYFCLKGISFIYSKYIIF